MLRNRGLGFGTQLIKRALIHHFGLDSSSVDYQGLFHHRPQFDAFIDFLQNPTSSCAIEWKYDGVRVQIHRHNNCFTVFGRSGEVGLRIQFDHRHFLHFSLLWRE